MGKQIFDRTKKILCIFTGIFFVISMTAVLIGEAAPPNENVVPTDKKITAPPSDNPQEITPPPPSDNPQKITPPPSKRHPPRCIHWHWEKKCDRWDQRHRSRCIHWHWEKKCDRWGPYYH